MLWLWHGREALAGLKCHRREKKAAKRQIVTTCDGALRSIFNDTWLCKWRCFEDFKRPASSAGLASCPTAQHCQNVKAANQIILTFYALHFQFTSLTMKKAVMPRGVRMPNQFFFPDERPLDEPWQNIFASIRRGGGSDTHVIWETYLGNCW